jgi:hypothetical protein
MLTQIHDLLVSWNNQEESKAETIEKLTKVKEGEETIDNFFAHL